VSSHDLEILRISKTDLDLMKLINMIMRMDEQSICLQASHTSGQQQNARWQSFYTV